MAERSNHAILFDQEMKILDSSICDKEYAGTCGEIVDITKEGIVVKTEDGAITLKKIKPLNIVMKLQYVNGHPVAKVSDDKLDEVLRYAQFIKEK